MSIKEVRQHIIFHLLLWIMLGVCFILSLLFILFYGIPNAKADTINVNNNSYCSSGSNSSRMEVSVQSDKYNVQCAAVGSNFGGKLYYLEFYLHYNFTANTTYTLTLQAISNDWRDTINDILVYNMTSNSRINHQYTFMSRNKIRLVFTPTSNSTNIKFVLQNSNNLAITGDTTWGILSMTLDFTGQNDAIIQNNNENTTDIINNNNQNTIDIINAINNNTADLCTNILNYTSFANAYNGATIQSVNPNEVVITSNSAWGWLQYELITTSGTTYYVNGSARCNNSNSTPLIQICADRDCANMLYNFENSGDFNGSFVASGSTTYFRLFATKGLAPQTSNYYKVMISSTSDEPYCAFGSYVSKQDKQIQLTKEQLEVMERFGITANDTNAYLKDNSDPSISNSDIENTLGLVSVSDPLSYLLTLPLNIINKVNIALNSQCSDYTIGHFNNIGNANFSSYTFKFPCIQPANYIGSTLWTTIDIIMAVGLLVVTISKFYHAIMNILTLGAEDKAEKQFKYWTPMEFLCVCLGGNFYDKAYQSHFGGDE